MNKRNHPRSGVSVLIGALFMVGILVTSVSVFFVSQQRFSSFQAEAVREVNEKDRLQGLESLTVTGDRYFDGSEWRIRGRVQNDGPLNVELRHIFLSRLSDQALAEESVSGIINSGTQNYTVGVGPIHAFGERYHIKILTGRGNVFAGFYPSEPKPPVSLGELGQRYGTISLLYETLQWRIENEPWISGRQIPAPASGKQRLSLSIVLRNDDSDRALQVGGETVLWLLLPDTSNVLHATRFFLSDENQAYSAFTLGPGEEHRIYLGASQPLNPPNLLIGKGDVGLYSSSLNLYGTWEDTGQPYGQTLPFIGLRIT